MMDTRRPEADLRDLEALAFRAEQISAGDADIVEGEFADRGGVVLTAIQRNGRTRRTPGASIGTMTQEWRRVRSASKSVTPSTIRKLQRGCAAPVINHLRPLTM
jgi:hypothetical protein